MFDGHHTKALRAFETDQFDSIYSKVAHFRNSQRQIAKTKDKQFEWINEDRRLRHAEVAVIKQISNSLTKLLGECEKENNDNAYDDVKSIAEDLAVYESSSTTHQQGGKLLSLAAEVKNTIASLNNDGLHSQLILDMRENLLVVEEDLAKRHSSLIGDLQECRRKAMFLMSADEECDSNKTLPTSLVKVLAAARAVEKANQLEGGDGEFQVDLLEHELKREFADERKKLNSALACLGEPTLKCNVFNWDEQSIKTFKSICSTTKKHSLLSSREEDQIIKRLSLALPLKPTQEIKEYLLQLDARRSSKAKEKSAYQDYEKRCLQFEQQGKAAVENLISDIEKRNESIEKERLNRVKSNELRLRLQAQRIVNLTEEGILSKQGGRTEAHKIHTVERSLRAKKTLWNAESKNTQERRSITDEVNMEASRLSKHRANKERTIIRASQMQNKLESKKNSDIASAKAEERRLERLCALAASVPYYKNIMNATPDIYKTTEARKADIFTKRDMSLADFQCGLHQLKSFTNDKMFSDSKFRLANALHEAGVAQSLYARDVVRNTIPRAEERTTGIRPY